MKPAGKFGEKVYYFEKVTSTMDIARKLAEKGEPEGSVVIAEKQVAGRGRFRRKWYSPAGGIFFSLILRPGILPEEVGKINLLAAVSLAETLKELYALPAKIKWPNDVLVRGKKISGILIEMNTKIDGINPAAPLTDRTSRNKAREERDITRCGVNWVVLGIGINANNPQKSSACRYLYPATSVKEEFGKEIPGKVLLKRLLREMEKKYFEAKRKGFSGLLKKWKRLSDTLGREVKLDTAQGVFFGKAVDLDSEGALILKLSNGEEKKILAGDCYHLIGRP